MHLYTLLLDGLINTLLLSICAFAGGGIIGLIVALLRVSDNRTLKVPSRVYISLIQGIPLLVLMGAIFFGSSILGLGEVVPFSAAVAALSIYASAYLGEIWRGCIQSIEKEQWEAAECLGLNRFQRMYWVIFPQAISISLPPTVGFMVQIVKNTSVASLIVGVPEITYYAKVISNSTFQSFKWCGVAAILYFTICFPLSHLSRKLERSFNGNNRSS
ncbi:amino acid ABC transporter permease [Shinella sp. S4-D37]|uniref:amino acid ABC transporter permease n=1 Tax=Shinella sp. S4-D37 TaxID=3161999 RepID=UPI0034662F23